MIRSVPTGASFTFRSRRMGSAQTTQGIYATVETGANFIPVVGPFVAAAAAVANAFGIGKGCGGTCTAATQVVNQIAPLMQQNLDAARQQAQANGGFLTPDEQAAAVFAYNQLWAQVLKGCGQVPAPGGTQCIADRQPGGKYPWNEYYLTPIQNIPVQQGAAVTPAQIAANTAASLYIDPVSGMRYSTPQPNTASNSPNLLLIGGAALAAVLVAKSL